MIAKRARVRQHAAGFAACSALHFDHWTKGVATDSFLRLLPAAISNAITQSSSAQRRAFAIACANLAVEHCTFVVIGLDDGAELTLAAMRDRALSAVDRADVAAIDAMLARREEGLYTLLCALRSNDAEAPYNEFLRLSTHRHTVRALRAALVPDGLSAAARAAFETISATRNEEGVTRLLHDTMLSAT
jgi:hypothetical protein